MANVLGNVSFTEYADFSRSVKKVIGYWQSGDGTYNGTAWGTTTNVFDGQVVMTEYYTSGGVPTNAYNVRVFDKDGQDVLASQGLARTNTDGVYQYSSIGAVSHSNLNFYIAGANVSRNGYVVMYIR